MSERIGSASLSFGFVLACGALGSACSKDHSPLAPLPVSAQVSLAAGQFTLISDSAVRGAVEFPSAGAGDAAYLVVGQLASTGEMQQAFSLGAQAFPPDLRLQAPTGSATPPSRFHALLREREAEFARQASLHRPLLVAPPVRAAPPTVGSRRTFKVCADIDCNSLKNVPATAQFVGTHAAIFVDDSVPASSLGPSDVTEIGDQFDQVLWPIDNARFGAESDIDNNGVVIVLLTRQINNLVRKPDCNTSFITGFFFGADIAPGFAAQYNNGEVFYGMVPQPAETSTNCAYSTSYVKSILPVTFIHEFQHMISFNQHVLVRGGETEVLWLNEAMSHLAEELGGLHYDSAGVTAKASRFFEGDLYNAFIWMTNPVANAMVSETAPGTLEERGAEWLFLRYVVDQFGDATTLALEQTAQLGASNLEAVTGTTFRTLLGRWALAVYLTDLPGFIAPPSLSYTYWSFRNAFASLHATNPQNFPKAFPLNPDSGQGIAVATAGTLHAGSAAYVLATQLASASGFQLTLRGPNGGQFPVTAVPQLAIARIR